MNPIATRKSLPAFGVLACLFVAGAAPALASPPLPLEDSEQFLEKLQSALAKLVDKVGPSVVAIQTSRSPAGLGSRPDWEPRVWGSTGSGVIIREDGMILTSQHVVDNAITIHVTLHDGRRFRAREIASDRRSDIAILRIHADRIKAARLSDVTNVKRGHIVMALGNPLGLSSDGQAAVSHGLVSAIGRPLPETFGLEEDRYYGDMIQTTAPINPGNSGGPLIDIRGRVIGIITAVSTRSDGHEGIGFAVPISGHTKAIIDKLMRGQTVEYGYIGVEVDEISAGDRSRLKLGRRSGVLVHSVLPGGPAEQAGIRGGDIVLTLNGQSTKSVEDFVRTIGACGPGRAVEVGFLRGSVSRTAQVQLVRRPTQEDAQLPDVTFAFRGAELGTVKPMMRIMANLPENGFLVLRVDAGSPADRAGLTPGDIIIRIEGKPPSKASIEMLRNTQSDLLLGLANGGSVLVKAK